MLTSSHTVMSPTTFILTLTLLWGWWGRCEKKLSPEGGRKGGWRKKSARSAPGGPGAQTRDLPRARQGSPAAHRGAV